MRKGFDYSQFVMNHRSVPALLVGGEMADHTLQEWAAKAFVLVKGAQFCPFFVGLMLNLIAFGRDALLKDLFGGPCRKIASKRHRDSSCQHLTQHDQQ